MIKQSASNFSSVCHILDTNCVFHGCTEIIILIFPCLAIVCNILWGIGGKYSFPADLAVSPLHVSKVFVGKKVSLILWIVLQ